MNQHVIISETCKYALFSHRVCRRITRTIKAFELFPVHMFMPVKIHIYYQYAYASGQHLQL